MSGASVSVVGGGPWGLALARAAARAGSEVTLVSRRHVTLEGVRVVSDNAEAARSPLVVLAVPTEAMGAVLDDLGPRLHGGHFVLHGVRGLAGDGLVTISTLVRDRTPARRVGALGGPVLVDELTAGAPSVMVVGSHFAEVLTAAREAFEHKTLRLYMTRDLVGLEWASALTAILAIAIGFAVGSGAGPGVVAAFTTRAVHEAARIATAAGGEQATLLGLAGLGDLLAAINQPGRPEVALGAALARGTPLDVASRELVGGHVGALELLPRLLHWIEEKRLRAPILASVGDALSQRFGRDELINRLMTEPQSSADRNPRASL